LLTISLITHIVPLGVSRMTRNVERQTQIRLRFRNDPNPAAVLIELKIHAQYIHVYASYVRRHHHHHT
jgi:hypothetical protein